MTLNDSTVFVELAPFRIEPRFVERVWGWKDLHPWYDRVAEKEPIGEVWLTGDDCCAATGPYAGKTLRSIFRERPEAMLGGGGASSSDSPLLIKVLFAREKLSVQVHPDDRLAQKYGEPRGKTECWYALASEPGAQVALGLKPGVTMDEIKAGIEGGTLEQSLNLLTVRAGDMMYVDAGTVHAIWPGSVLLETQQNCDLTYRMYDYGRGRELHIEKSLEATRLRTAAGKVLPKTLEDRTVLVDSPYFSVERIPVEVSRSSKSLQRANQDKPGLAYLFAAAGSGRLSSPSFGTVELPPCGIIAVPASSPLFSIQDMGELDLILITARTPGTVA
ncbi:class I mannose-6-phosphate isomerase [Telmatobacter sp. DSM 110680]|uniref:Class I mannose-6-phosphate isomerase n=1 Tax=Telmatobacter sp. DSM 110680 TaxID=3036704 RepID=A0AAU7DQ76_9BACT